MAQPKDSNPDPALIPEDQPTDWFEVLYSSADKDGTGVPWANMATHPSFAKWVARNPVDGQGKTALVVGCGMGDDAIALEALGFRVTAFDVSATAIELCKERFPQSTVDFLQADLLADQPQWDRKFDLVLEIFTVQALPPKYEDGLIESIAGFVAPNGLLVVIAETSEEPRTFENGPPWLLTSGHIQAFASHGLLIEQELSEPSDFPLADRLLVTTLKRSEGSE
ncbi:class I SAM-dependent methyltransferase [Sulfitobacter mediterraneus]|uniref:Methyltransferase family protein n=1 Tax=Sulfitobacter mediterraneus TaxID=83219 RepID=A0A2T6CCQ5_9RHOB|nr:class I SAM-dependent methyltransferase [Sulfitobacter mediterraneus]KIN78135.1 Methyltransferase type 12 [Sulfitobacter mediterraneus KCTC 32188]PTX73298.1 methyltransferase family protein [Sulfitobacter mediterraneus]